MLLDIGVGIALSLAISKVFAVEPTALFILGGIAFTLLPDIDAIVELLKYKHLGGYEPRIHREWIHYPLLYIPVALAVYYFWGIAWASLLFLGATAHFIHDSMGIGWGIKWLGPFSLNNYKLFSEKNGAFSKRLLIKWVPEEFAETLKRHHNPNWFREYYLRPTFINIFEFLVFGAAIILLYFYLK